MPVPTADPTAGESTSSPARSGLLLSEHLDLAADPAAPVDSSAGARRDAVVRSWLDGAGVLPGPLDGRADGALAGRVAPAEDARAWLTAALRDGAALPVRMPDLAPWQTSLFGLLAPAIDTARRQAGQGLDGLPGQACAEWLRFPPVALLRLLTGTFVLDMDAARGLPGAPADVPDWFDHHLATLCAPGGREAFADRYPLLGRLAGEILRGWRDAAAEFGRRLSADAPAIAELLGTAPDRLVLTGVRPGLGDVHRHGRTVARVTFAQGQVAYKPRPVGAARGLRELADHLSDRYGIAADVHVPTTVDRGGHGWMVWIEPEPCPDLDAARRYYRRLGRLNALAWLLGANDLHSENIVARGDTPYLVDVETLLTPVPRHVEAGHDHPAAGIVLESPASTGILPFSLDLGDGHTADLSAFGDRAGQVGAEVTTWDAAGTGEMRAVRRRLPQADPASVPTTADGTAVDPFDFSAEVAAGSADLLAALAPIAAELATEVGRRFTGRGRVLLRDTARYGEVVEYVRHPAVLHEPFLADGAFEPLLDPRLHPDPAARRAVVAAERAALLRGDVPLFEVAPDRRDLVADGGTVVPGFFAGSPLERMRARAERLAVERPALDWVTAASMRAAQLNRDRRRDRIVCCAEPLRAPVPAATLVAAATAIAARIATLACRDEGEISWLTLRVGAGEQWQVAAADDSLYLGTTGVLVFLEALAATDPAIDELRRRLRAQWQAREPDGAHGLGAYTGVAGDLWVAHLLADGERAGRLVDVLAAPTDELDLFSGAAGIVLVLARVATGDLRDRALAVAGPHVRRLLDGAVAQDAGAAWVSPGLGALIGFAHGSSGIAYALGEYVAADPDGPLAAGCRAAVRVARDWERARFDEEAGTWPDLRVLPAAQSTVSTSWCNGSAGIGLARVGALRRGDPDPDPAELGTDVDRAVAVSLARGLGLGQGMCHGDLGVVETLLAAAEVRDRPEWTAAAQRIAGMVAADVLDRDGVATLEFGPGVDTPGLVNGAAGVGYQLLRTAAPDRVPSVLTLDRRP